MPIDVALNLPWWFVVLVVIACVYLLVMTRNPREAYAEMVAPDPGVASTAVSAAAIAAVEPAPVRDPLLCGCPYCATCQQLHARGFTYVKHRWLPVN